LSLFYPRIKIKEIVVNRKRRLVVQFKEALYSISTSLSAGMSIETALKFALKDLEIIYHDPDTHIIKEIGYVVKKIEMNETVEGAFSEFAARSNLEDVISFADVLHTCKRTGGNLVEVIKSTSAIISDKITIKQEIDTMLSEKRLEQKVMSLMPLIMVVFLTISGGDYMDPIFNTAIGRVIMTIAAVLVAIAYLISKKIMEIKV
jgi:tight adherence protein B